MRILAIGAHFDDVEIGCGGTLLKHGECNDEIFILVITHSGYRNPNNKHLRSKKQALEEGMKSASCLGAKLHCLNNDPLSLVNSELLALQIENYVNQVKPDRVYTHRPTDHHSDHAAVGLASMRACRRCKDILLYRSNWYLNDIAEHEDYYVDITAYNKVKQEILNIFKSEMGKNGNSWLKFIQKQNHADGLKIDVKYAEAFRTVKMTWQ